MRQSRKRGCSQSPQAPAPAPKRAKLNNGDEDAASSSPRESPEEVHQNPAVPSGTYSGQILVHPKDTSAPNIEISPPSPGTAPHIEGEQTEENTSELLWEGWGKRVHRVCSNQRRRKLPGKPRNAVHRSPKRGRVASQTANNATSTFNMDIDHPNDLSDGMSHVFVESERFGRRLKRRASFDSLFDDEETESEFKPAITAEESPFIPEIIRQAPPRRSVKRVAGDDCEDAPLAKRQRIEASGDESPAEEAGSAALLNSKLQTACEAADVDVAPANVPDTSYDDLYALQLSLELDNSVDPLLQACLLSAMGSDDGTTRDPNSESDSRSSEGSGVLQSAPGNTPQPGAEGDMPIDPQLEAYHHAGIGEAVGTSSNLGNGSSEASGAVTPASGDAQDDSPPPPPPPPPSPDAPSDSPYTPQQIAEHQDAKRTALLILRKCESNPTPNSFVLAELRALLDQLPAYVKMYTDEICRAFEVWNHPDLEAWGPPFEVLPVLDEQLKVMRIFGPLANKAPWEAWSASRKEMEVIV